MPFRVWGSGRSEGGLQSTEPSDAARWIGRMRLFAAFYRVKRRHSIIAVRVERVP